MASSKLGCWKAETEDNEDWQVGHPVLFPNILLSGSTSRPTFQIRVPIDDTTPCTCGTPVIHAPMPSRRRKLFPITKFQCPALRPTANRSGRCSTTTAAKI